MGEPMQEPLHAAALELDHSTTNAGVASRAKANNAKCYPQERVRQGPNYCEESE